MPGCCGVTALRSTTGEPLYSNPREYAADVGKLLRELRDRYGSGVEISVVNSWGFWALADVIRLKITPSKPAWVLDGKKIFEGVPDPGVLFDAIDSALAGGL
ncbi:MAG: hypothetical protein LBR87_09290 [Synergistaceae bacterium]|nr:hypothetical protein [Synergistaceae bacterium]